MASLVDRIADRLLGRADALPTASYIPSVWQNLATGLGGAADRTTYHLPSAVTPLTTAQLAVLYLGDPFAARIVSAIVDDAMRQGWTIVYGGGATKDEDLLPEIEGELSRLGAESAIRRAAKWGRLYGLGCVVLITDDGSPSTPLAPERVRKVERLTVVDKRDLFVRRWNAAGEHETYTMQLVSSTMTQLAGEIHASRLLRLGGRDTSVRDAIQYFDGFDCPVLQPVWETIRGFTQSWAGAGAMLMDGSIGVLKLPRLAEMLSLGARAVLLDRLQTMRSSLWLGKWLPIDKEDELQFVSRSFAGIPELLTEQKTLLAAAAEMPVTRLFGISPAGLNATGVSDEKSWHATVAAYQRAALTPPVSSLVQLVAGTLGASEPDAFAVTWPALEILSSKEEADLEESVCRADQARVAIGMPEETILRHRYGGAAYRADPPLLDDRELAELGEHEGAESEEPVEPEPIEPAGEEP